MYVLSINKNVCFFFHQKIVIFTDIKLIVHYIGV